MITDKNFHANNDKLQSEDYHKFPHCCYKDEFLALILVSSSSTIF
jgi:hypothetical protein